MKLSTWAKQQGLTYKGAWNLFKQGLIPNAYKLGSGTIIVKDDEELTTELQKELKIINTKLDTILDKLK